MGFGVKVTGGVRAVFGVTVGVSFGGFRAYRFCGGIGTGFFGFCCVWLLLGVLIWWGFMLGFGDDRLYCPLRLSVCFGV